MFIRTIHEFDDHDEVLVDPSRIAQMRKDLLDGDVYIARRVVPKEKLLAIREYLIGIGRGSLPNYRSIEPRCPNFHRIDRWDPRAHVGSCFHSFSFFPWNQDIFDLFNLFRPVYHLKNLISELDAESFLGQEPDRGCTARMSFHCYPKGSGGLNRHQDPFDYHQTTVPIMMMSKKGQDFHEGGAYVENSEGQRIVLDDRCDVGDVYYFNAQCFHGVNRIDPDEPEDWFSFQGRWMILFAVNQIAGHSAIADSRDLERANK